MTTGGYKVSQYPMGAQSGFTLLELMISVALLGLLVLIVSGAMRLGYRSLEKGEQKTEALERLTVSCTIIDAQIQSAVPLNIAGSAENRYIIEGTQDIVRFASNYSLFGGQRGYVVVTYRVETDRDNKHTLYVQENIRGFESGRETKLLEGFDDIRFEYFLRRTTDGPEEWTADLQKSTSFPLKVRVCLARGDRKVVMIIPMKARGIQT